MATDFDPYAILEVERSAGKDEIDQAYRRQWAAYPNAPTPDARLREIQTAYRILSDPEERRAYDSRLAGRAADGIAPRHLTPISPTTEERSGRVPWGVGDVFLGVLVTIGLGLFYGIPFAIVADLVADGPVKEDGTAVALELMGSIPLELGFVFAVWLLAIRKYKVTWESIGFRKPAHGSWWLPFALLGAALAIVTTFSLILDIVGKHPDTDLGHAAYVNAFPATVLVILTVICAPLMEETFFRGFAFPGFSRRWGFVWGAVASGVLFGLAHSLNPGGLYVVFPITAIGILFAWGAYYSNSILPTIAAHFLFNGLQILVALVSPPEDNDSALIAPAFVHLLQTITRLHL